MESIIVKEVKSQLNRLDISFDVSSGLEKYFAPEHHFWAEYSCDISDVPQSVLVLPILCNLLQFSWIVDCIVWVNEVDRTFYEQIPELKNAFREMYPNFNFGGTLIPAKLVENSYIPQREAVQLFTGGVDATTTFLRIREKNPILFYTYGWYKKEINDNPVFRADKQAIDAFALENNVEAHYVRSNFCTFIHGTILNKKYGKKLENTWWFGFQHSLAFLGCACVLGYHFRVNALFIASSYTFGQSVVCASDPRTDNCIKCGAMKTIHDGYELSRMDKVRFIVTEQKKLKNPIHLRVCSFKEKNCCRCEKCFRTMLAIVAEGGNIEDFGFKLEKSLLESLEDFLNSSIMELDEDHIVFWRDIVNRMGENYRNMTEKEVYNYLKDFPYSKEKRRYLFRYYSNNFFEILKRKLHVGK